MRELLSKRSDRVALECRGELSQVRFYSGGSEPNDKAILPTDVLRTVHLALHERSYLWPELNDQFFATNPRRRRLHFSSESNLPFMADIIAEQQKDHRAPSLVLENIVTHAVEPLLPRLQLSAANNAIISKLLNLKSGIVLTAPTGKNGSLDAAALALALRPDCALYVSPTDERVIEAILDAAEKRVVVISHGSEDAIEMIFDFMAVLNHRSDLETRFLNSLALTISHKRVKRVCGNCARPTIIGASTLEKIPSFLAPAEGQSYMFGRGCPLCGHAAYRGTVGVESACYVTPEIRSALLDRASFNKLFEIAYGQGYRTAFEDGMAKISQGLTSYEEVMTNAKRPTDLLAKIYSKKKVAQSAPPVEELKPLHIDENAPSVKEEFFINAPLAGGIAKAKATPKILIVEDDADQRAVLELVFKTEGYNILMAASALEALRLLREQLVDLVVCDLMMPEISGEELTVRIKSDPVFKTIPVLILTAVESDDAEYASLSKGADDYVPKTIKRKLLLKRVEKLLQRS